MIATCGAFNAAAVSFLPFQYCSVFKRGDRFIRMERRGNVCCPAFPVLSFSAGLQLQQFLTLFNPNFFHCSEDITWVQRKVTAVAAVTAVTAV